MTNGVRLLHVMLRGLWRHLPLFRACLTDKQVAQSHTSAEVGEVRRGERLTWCAARLCWEGSKQFYNATGTTREKVHFCREWDEKADVCKELGVTIVVEASSSSAGALESVVEAALLFGEGTDVLQGSKPRQDGEPGSQALLWWDSVCAELLPLTPELPASGAANAEDAAAGSSGREEDGSEKQKGRKKEGNDAQKQQESQQGGGAGEEKEEFFSGDEGGRS